MKPMNVVISQQDQRQTQALAASLRDHFKMVAEARSFDELRRTIARNRADAVVLDLETATLLEVDELRREYPQLTIVCTHRLADEYMWTAALAVGAQDCCHPSDVRGIVHAASHTVVMARTTAA